MQHDVKGSGHVRQAGLRFVLEESHSYQVLRSSVGFFMSHLIAME